MIDRAGAAAVGELDSELFGIKGRRTYQPLAVSLDAVAVEVEVLDGHLLRGEARAEGAADGALVDGAEAALAEEVGGGEVLGDGLELVQGEGVQAGGGQRPRQVLQRQRPQVHHRAPPPRPRRRPRLMLRLLVSSARAEARQEALPEPHVRCVALLCFSLLLRGSQEVEGVVCDFCARTRRRWRARRVHIKAGAGAASLCVASWWVGLEKGLINFLID